MRKWPERIAVIMGREGKLTAYPHTTNIVWSDERVYELVAPKRSGLAKRPRRAKRSKR